MRLHYTDPAFSEPLDIEVWEATDTIDRKVDELEAERMGDGWDYRLPERFQENAEVAEYQPPSDSGWDYRLPERYRY